MPHAFDITTSTPVILLNDAGAGEASFTFSNALGRPVRVGASVQPEGNAPRGWFELVGSPELELQPEGFQHLTVKVSAHRGAQPGAYPFRLLLTNLDNPAEFTASAWVDCHVPTQAMPARGFDTRWALATASFVALVAVLAYVFLPRPTGSRVPGPKPLATATFTLNPAQTSRLPAIGSGDGQPFSDPCPPGHVATGFDYRLERSISGFRLACRPLHSDGTLGRPLFADARGDVVPAGATRVSAACPDNEVLVGQGLDLDRDALSAVGSACVSPAMMGVVLPEEGTRVGALASGASAWCPPGMVVTGSHGRAADRLSQLGFDCTQLVRQPPPGEAPVSTERRLDREQRSGRRAQEPQR